MTGTGPATAFVALGANLDEPDRQVRQGLASLADLPGTQLVRHSSLYRTAPVGVGMQPAYINAVAELRTTLSAPSLLEALLDLERSAGRLRLTPGAPRTLDLDLLLYGNEQRQQPGLVVPHPRMHLRAFVLVPLLEIAPEVQIPGRGRAAAWHPVVCNQDIARIGDNDPGDRSTLRVN